MRSAGLQFYKGIGAAQFNPIAPKLDERGYVVKDGAVMLDMAPGIKGKEKEWDWSQKIVFAIGIADLAQLMDGTKESFSLVHDNNGVIKTLRLVPGDPDKYPGTYMLSLSEKNGEVKRDVRVSLNNGEYVLLMRMLAAIAPSLLGWNTMEPYLPTSR
jgi:hypothetical protein